MKHIQVTLTEEEDQLIKAAATRERRSKTSQFKLSAIQHALTICPEMKIGKPMESPKSLRKSLTTTLVEFLSFGKPTPAQFTQAVKLRNALKA